MDARGEENMVWQKIMEQPNTWIDAKLPLRSSMGNATAKKWARFLGSLGLWRILGKSRSSLWRLIILQASCSWYMVQQSGSFSVLLRMWNKCCLIYLFGVQAVTYEKRKRNKKFVDNCCVVLNFSCDRETTAFTQRGFYSKLVIFFFYSTAFILALPVYICCCCIYSR